MMTAFFYGLFLDPDILKDLGFSPKKSQLAKLEHYKLVIGERANLIKDNESVVWGNLIDMSEEELKALYSEKSVSAYEKQTVTCIRHHDQQAITADVYILPDDYIMKPAKDSGYIKKLLSVCQKYNFPEDYLNILNQMIDEIGDQ